MNNLKPKEIIKQVIENKIAQATDELNEVFSKYDNAVGDTNTQIATYEFKAALLQLEEALKEELKRIKEDI